MTKWLVMAVVAWMAGQAAASALGIAMEEPPLKAGHVMSHAWRYDDLVRREASGVPTTQAKPARRQYAFEFSKDEPEDAWGALFDAYEKIAARGGRL